MGKANGFSNLEVKWVQKKDGGGEMEYESFIYDGVAYTLYDCVYMYHEGSPDPYIGKLIKIWEHSDRTKKVRVQWFFRQGEISKWVGDAKMLENEVFIATGSGIGLTNDNPLEAVAGKCNVVCISKDHRNPQPSDEELKGAEYIFFRAFDVQTCTILDKMDDKVGELEIKYIFNRKQSERAIIVPKCDSDRKEVSRSSWQLLTRSSSDKLKALEADKNDGQLTRKMISKPKCTENLVIERESLSDVKRNEETGRTDDFIANSNKNEKPVNNKEAKETDITSGKREKLTDRTQKKDLVDNFIKLPEDCHVGIKESKRTAADSKKLKDIPSKKVKADDSIKSPEEHKLDHEKMLPLRDAYVKALARSFISEEKPNHKNRESVLRPDEQLEGRASKKSRLGSSLRVSCNKNKDTVQKLRTNVNGDNRKDLDSMLVSSEEKQNFAIALDSVAMEEPPRELPREGKKQLSVGKLPKVSNPEADDDKKSLYEEFVVTPKPPVESNGLFKELLWEERLPGEYKLGRVVMLHNLDPDYTSSEVEDIVWHAFEENCKAKMLQNTAISSPQCGQALVMFKTKKAAERVLMELDVGNLMLSNGRPLVGTDCPPITSGECTKFLGHLDLKKIKLRRQREMREMEEVVSHSYYSQPNAIEFEMALEWRLQQMWSDIWWEKLYQQQMDELKELEAKMKQKTTMDGEVRTAACVSRKENDGSTLARLVTPSNASVEEPSGASNTVDRETTCAQESRSVGGTLDKPSRGSTVNGSCQVSREEQHGSTFARLVTSSNTSVEEPSGAINTVNRGTTCAQESRSVGGTLGKPSRGSTVDGSCQVSSKEQHSSTFARLVTSSNASVEEPSGAIETVNRGTTCAQERRSVVGMLGKRSRGSTVDGSCQRRRA